MTSALAFFDRMKVLVPLAAILSITVLEGIALTRGLDGSMLSVSIAAVAAIGGFTLRAVVRDEDR